MRPPLLRPAPPVVPRQCPVGARRCGDLGGGGGGAAVRGDVPTQAVAGGEFEMCFFFLSLVLIVVAGVCEFGMCNGE